MGVGGVEARAEGEKRAAIRLGLYPQIREVTNSLHRFDDGIGTCHVRLATEDENIPNRVRRHVTRGNSLFRSVRAYSPESRRRRALGGLRKNPSVSR
jgi:hypothetical protein